MVVAVISIGMVEARDQLRSKLTDFFQQLVFLGGAFPILLEDICILIETERPGGQSIGESSAPEVHAPPRPASGRRRCGWR